MPGPALEQLEVGPHVLGRERDEVGDDIEVAVAQRGAYRRRVAHIRLQQFRPGGAGRRALSPRLRMVSSMPRSTASALAPWLIVPVPPMKRTLSAGMLKPLPLR